MQRLRKLTFWLVCATVFVVPLAFWPSANLVFEIPKVAAFRSLVLLICGGIAVTSFFDRKIVFFSEKWVSRFVAAWFLALALATVFSISPWTSFWGSYFRQQGLLQMIFYLAFFGAIVSVLDTEERIRGALKWLCAGAFLSAILAIVHYFGWGIYRAFGTMGHPNFLGSYLVMCLPFFFFWFVKVRGRALKVTVAFSVAVVLVALFLTFGKAAILGAVSAGLVFIFFGGSGGRKKLVWTLVGALGISVVALVVMGFANLGGGDSSSGSSGYESAPDRFLMRGDSVKSLEVRLDIWKETVSLVADRPLLGIGLDTFGRTHPEGESIGFGGVPDRAHNEILDSLISGGILGTFAYLSLLFYVFLTCYRRRADPLIVACASSFFGLFVANMFGFSTTVHYVIWWAVLGIIVVKTGERKRVEVVVKRSVATIAVAVIVAFLIFNFGFRFLYADWLYARGVDKVFEFKQEEAKEYFERAGELNPLEEYYSLGKR